SSGVLGHASGHMVDDLIEALPEIAGAGSQRSLNRISNLALQQLPFFVADVDAEVVGIGQRSDVGLEREFLSEFLWKQEAQDSILIAHSWVVPDSEQRAQSALVPDKILEPQHQPFHGCADCGLMFMQLVSVFDICRCW